MANTTHLQMPLLAAAQAQKHVTHNDAILRLDAIVQLSVKDRDLTAPPASPSDGDRYMPASGASGDWSGWDLNVAWYVDGVWAKLVPRAGWIAYVEDEDVILVHDGSAWALLPAAMSTWRVLAASAVAASHTGDTSETTLATVTVPGGTMGPNGILRITSVWSWTDSANTKRPRIRFGGPSGGQYLHIASATQNNDHGSFLRMISNRNSESSQVGLIGHSETASFGIEDTGLKTGSDDTSVDQDLVFTGLLTDAGETITLESYLVELFHQA